MQQLHAGENSLISCFPLQSASQDSEVEYITVIHTPAPVSPAQFANAAFFEDEPVEYGELAPEPPEEDGNLQARNDPDSIYFDLEN